MRTCIGISIVVHAVVMLWLLLAPGAETFNPASAEPIMVDLVPPQDAPRAAEQEPAKSDDTKSEDAKSEDAKSEVAKTEQPKSDLPQPAPPKPEPPKPELPKAEPIKPGSQANQKPAPRNDIRTATENSAEEQAATAARLAWMLNLPTDTATSLAAPPSENKSNLSREEVAEFKAQVSKCWVVPAGVPSTPGFDVLLRIALNPDGTLGAKPELIRAPASLAGPPLVESAKRALQKCQPYASLPADKYREWKILDLSFTAQGPSGLSGLPSGKSAAP
jgi:type IV secretory pathway VirB10-like protein